MCHQRCSVVALTDKLTYATVTRYAATVLSAAERSAVEQQHSELSAGLHAESRVLGRLQGLHKNYTILVESLDYAEHKLAEVSKTLRVC